MTSGLIGAGLIGIIVSAFSITLNSFQQSSRALAQKMEISQLQSNIVGRLTDGSLCECNLEDIDIPYAPDGGGGQGQLEGSRVGLEQNLELKALYGRCANNQPSNPIVKVGEPVADSLTNLMVKSIQIGDIRPISSQTLSAQLTVSFESEGLVIGRKPIFIPLTIQTAVSGGQTQIVSCTTQEAVVPSHGISSTMAGEPGTHCTYGGPGGPTGVTMYREQGDTKMCCIVSSANGVERFQCL